MMTLQKKKTAYCTYAEQGFEPCTLRTTAFRLTNQTASPSTMLVALVIKQKMQEYIQIMQFRHAFANYTSAIWDLLRILTTTYDFKQAMTWSPGLLFMIYLVVAH